MRLRYEKSPLNASRTAHQLRREKGRLRAKALSNYRSSKADGNDIGTQLTTRRHILWATSLVGGATLGALLIGLIRNKAVALIGGPTAVGLLGLFTSTISLGASVATLGLDTSAVRQLSSKIEDPAKASEVRSAVNLLACFLAMSGAAVLWVLRHPAAVYVLDDPSLADEVGWLALGVAATVLAASYTAVLQSYGLLGAVARVRVWGSALATAVSVAAIYWLGLTGIVVAAIASPVTTLILVAWYSRSLPDFTAGRPSWRQLLGQWHDLAAIGGTAMLAFAFGSVSQLGVRSIVARELGIEATGLFHASAAIIMVNLTLVLNAMAADYFPRLSKAVDRPRDTEHIFNEQLHVILVLASPALVLASALAPFLLKLLYADAFAQSAPLLRLLVAAGALRLLIFALGFLLLARRSGFAFLFGELLAVLALPLIWVLVRQFGLSGAGLGVLLASLLTCAAYWTRSIGLGLHISRSNMGYSIGLTIFLVALAWLHSIDTTIALVISFVGAAFLAVRSFGELRSMLAEA
jgi:O-antigen/teichoic acid export membrane protein